MIRANVSKFAHMLNISKVYRETQDANFHLTTIPARGIISFVFQVNSFFGTEVRPASVACGKG